MTAWETLINCDITSLPVDLQVVCSKLGISLLSYTQGYKIVKEFKLTNDTHNFDGFLLSYRGQVVVLYNPHLPVGRRRFTIAHEIGHYVLGHCSTDGIIHRKKSAKKHAPKQVESDPKEIEANHFASQLLAPNCVLRGLHVQSSFAIGQLCHISQGAAEVCLARLLRLEMLDSQWMVQRGRSFFFRSPTEWTLYQQFEPFIQSTTRPHSHRA